MPPFRFLITVVSLPFLLETSVKTDGLQFITMRKKKDRARRGRKGVMLLLPVWIHPPAERRESLGGQEAGHSLVISVKPTNVLREGRLVVTVEHRPTGHVGTVMAMRRESPKRWT